MSQARVLIAEDSESLALTFKRFLETGYDVSVAHDAAQTMSLLQRGMFDVLLLDLHLPDADGISFLQLLKKNNLRIPVVVVTADTSTENAVAAIRAGAEDYITKPVTQERMLLTVQHILERQSLRGLVDSYRTKERDRFCDFIGRSPAMQAVYRVIENAATSKAPVFIVGESGTGKELAARAVHSIGQRKTHPFEALNCAAIPANLIESEVFGHVKGAFTGATSNVSGAAARAHRGTLFMDELTEMPLELQSKLLRFTQTGSFRPVGGQQEVVVDVRFVSATNRDPITAVQEGRLREDLYYRLNVVPIYLPPLRERGDDVLLIADNLLQCIAGEEKKSFREISDDVKGFFLAYSWPGNVRQLENVIRRAIVLHDAEILTMDMLGDLADEAVTSHPVPLSEPSVKTEIAPLKEMERRIIEQAITLCGGNILQAARKLEVNPSTIHRKLNRWKKSS